MNISDLWQTFFRSSRRRLRIKPPGLAPLGAFAAEVLELRRMLSSAAATVPNVTVTVQGNNLTLTSTDINSPTVSITRTGGSVVIAGASGTQITLGSSVAASQSLALGSVGNLTISLGTGADTVAVTGLSVTGNVTINGQASGVANVSLSAGLTNAVIGGSIQANFGGEAATFGVFGSANGGGNFTVTGVVNVVEGGPGNQQVNLYGPPANNPTGGKLVLNGGVAILDTGNGQSGLRIDDGVTINGNVSFNNSVNTVNGDNVQIYSNSIAYGTTTINGTLSLSLSDAVYQGNVVRVNGFGTSLVVTGATDITSGGGADDIRLLNTWFKNTVTVDSGSSPSFSPDLVIFQGSRFDGAVNVEMDGPYAALGLGTDSTYSPTVFNSTFTASMTGASALAYLSNPTSTVNAVIFNSTAAFTGGTPLGTLFVQGHVFVNPGKLTLTKFATVTPPAAVANVTVTVVGNNLTLTSTDINNPTVSITRSGGAVVIAGSSGTLITFGSKVAAVQSLALGSVGNLTINLGTGTDTVAVSGLNVTGNVTINGQATGVANFSLSAGPTNAVIGGSIQANFGGEAATFGVFGSTNGGGNLTVTGPVNVTEGGSGNQQVNLYGPPANNPAGGKLVLNGGVTILDTGNGQSGLRIDDGVTVNGNVSFDNSVNTVNGDNVQIYSNSFAYGTTSINGALTMSLSNATYQGNVVRVNGFGSSLVVTGATSITSGGGGDDIRLLNTWLKNTVTVNAGSSPSFSPDLVIAQGSRFDGAVNIVMTGAYAALGLGTDFTYSPTVFNSTFTASMTGASALAYLSNPTSTVSAVIFNSTAAFTGGTPVGTLFVQGLVFVNPGKLTRTNFAFG